MQPAELMGLRLRALVLLSAPLWGWILGAGRSPEDLAEDTGCSHTGVQQATSGKTHSRTMGYLSQAKCKRGNFFFRMTSPLMDFITFLSLEVNVAILLAVRGVVNLQHNVSAHVAVSLIAVTPTPVSHRLAGAGVPTSAFQPFPGAPFLG